MIVTRIVLVLAIMGFTGTSLMAQHCSHRGAAGRQMVVPENLRSDTIDILNYDLLLDIRDFGGQTISGAATVRFRPLMNAINNLSLDLLMMTIDSVKQNNTHLAFSYNDTLLQISLDAVYNLGDTSELTVFYHGSPQQDPSGWGGFYWSGQYAFNLGVGFESIPHNFGRVWHPCFDNFVEHATYDFTVITNGGRKAYCNGEFLNETINGTDITRIWKMSTPIPSYLASVSVAPYTHVLRNYQSPFTSLNTPIWLIALPADTTNMKNSFINLPSAIEGFEWAYGPHYFNKVGFVLVPFSSGAMEHATNIAYPRITANGSLSYETLMAHELAHHWWGDLVTCETAYDMWINEGMASYSEYLFLEYFYSRQQYNTGIRNNHKTVVWKAHVDDNGFHALSAVPLEVTYGTTSYDKGADVVHTLRGYLGDSLFFAGLKTIIANNQLQNINSESFRDQLNAINGIDVTHFFEDWVLQPGFPEFSIDSVEVSGSGSSYDVTVHYRQKLRGALHYFNEVPITVFFRNSAWDVETRQVLLSGNSGSVTVTLPFVPVQWSLNDDERISEAVTADNWAITSPGFKSFSHSNFQLNADAVTDSAFIRVEHHWVAADPFFVNDFLNVISPDRFWRISGLGWNENVVAQGRFSYNGTTSSGGYLDNLLMTDYGSMLFHEDSIRLFYREHPGLNWTEYPYYTRSTQASKTDKVGLIIADSLRLGDYAFGMRISALDVSDFVPQLSMRVFPNPAHQQFQMEVDGPLVDQYELVLVDLTGRVILHSPVNQRSTLINTNGMSAGTYIIQLRRGDQMVSVSKIILH
jgi:hypothetical protein